MEKKIALSFPSGVAVEESLLPLSVVVAIVVVLALLVVFGLFIFLWLKIILA